ncbi:MAG: hypothetical protein Q4G04_03630 [bacterium]|nr:hypothetical protein [bacterium]
MMLQTHTIDIEYIRRVLEQCPHYDAIVNYDYIEGDELSLSLIEWYRELVFSVNIDDENQMKVISAIDKSLSIYIKDNNYKRQIHDVISTEEISINDGDLLINLIKKIVNFTTRYQKKEVLEVEVSQWL